MNDKRPPIALLIVVGVVALAAIIAVVASIGSDDDDDTAGRGPETIESVSGSDINGAPLTIDATDGRPKVIIGVAHWCPHCQAEVPRITDHLAETGMPEDVDLVTVSTAIDPQASNYPPKAWLDREGWEIPTLDDFDGSIATSLGIKGFPYFLVVDAEGQVVERTSGELSTDEFDDLVEAARTGDAPS